MDNIKQVPIIVGIAVLFALLIGFGIEAFYEGPKYEDFCTPAVQAKLYPPTIPTPTQGVTCPDYSSDPNVQQCYTDKGNPVFTYDSKGCQNYKSCDYCQRDFDNQRKIHDRNVFFITAPIGIIAIIFGVLFTIDFIGSGFMFGGILTLFYGTVRYFNDMNKYVKVLVLFLELLIIAWIGYKKLRSREKHKK